MLSPGRLTLLVLLLWAAGLGAAGQFAKVGVILPELSALYPGHDASIGFLVSLISVLGVIFGLIAGSVLGQMGAKRLLLLSLTLGAGASLFQALLPPFPVFLVSRLVEGLSHLGIVVAAPTLIGTLTPSRHKGLAMSLWATFFGVAFAIMAWLGLPFVSNHGPASLFFVHGGYMLLVAISLTLILPTQQQSSSHTSATTGTLSLKQWLQRHHQVYTSPFIAAPALGWLFYATGFVSMVTTLPTLVASTERAWVAGLMPLSAILMSMTVGVFLLQHLPAVKVVTLGFCLAIATATLLLLFPIKPWMPIALAGAMGLIQGASYAAIPQLNPAPTDQALANGGMAQTGNLGNLFGIPLVLSVLAHYGPDVMMAVIIGLFTLGLASHIATARVRARIVPPVVKQSQSELT